MIHFAGRAIPDRLEEIVDPKRSALLVWDMQYDIATRAFNYQEILGNIKQLTAAARKAGIPVVYSQQTAFDLKYETAAWVRRRTQQAKVADPAQVPARTMEGTRGWEVVDELKPQSGDVVFKKHRPSAFIATDLDLILRNRGIDTVVLTGVSTEGGIEGSARHGANLGHYMVVVRDAVGSHDREGHEMALKFIEKTFDVVDSKQLLAIWGKAG